MNKTLLTITILLLNFQVFSQANKQKATLIFKNGTELNCFARIAGDNIRYVEKNIRDVEIAANYKVLKGIKIYMNDNLVELYYKIEEGKSTPKLMEKVIIGKVNLFRIQNVYESNIGFDSNSNYFKKKSANTAYFLESKNNTEEVIRFVQNFEENAKIYFSDCKLLTDQLGNDNFRKKDILKIVIYYNENCGKANH